MSATATLSVEPSLANLTPDVEIAVEIVVPVYNEQQDLAASIERLHSYLSRNFPLSWLITVADNASTDNTWAIACGLAKQLDYVRALHIPQKGRGRALRTAWLQSRASVVAYMDVDLSTDLDALLPLVAPLLTGHSDVAIGSRLAPGARVVRGPKREFISRTYNFVLRTTLRNSFSDAQCGFKAVRTEVARQLVPLVEDNGWFFDTEMLVLAERSGLRVHEVAVDWVDDAGSTVNLVQTARDDLKGIARMMRAAARRKGELAPRRARALAPGGRLEPGWTGQLVHFASVGLVSTVSFAFLFALLYGPLGGVGADIIALAICALGNLAANRHFTFDASGPTGRRHYYLTGFLLALLPLVSTLGALAAASAAGISSLPALIVILTAVNLLSTVARFYCLRASVTKAMAQ
ncbi:MAG TPA: dolichyl-phosphate beta-glucosyltransferase [Acidimicrobiales bacterium]|nr:dolichyl-phosphate beta-glucosyltransferase [Acidimicrobiales bacterium]